MAAIVTLAVAVIIPVMAAALVSATDIVNLVDAVAGSMILVSLRA